MRCDRNHAAGVVREDVEQRSAQAEVAGGVGFAREARPEGVWFGEAWFEVVEGAGFLDGGFGGAGIAGLQAYCFAEELYPAPSVSIHTHTHTHTPYIFVSGSEVRTSLTTGRKGLTSGISNPSNMIPAVSKHLLNGET